MSEMVCSNFALKTTTNYYNYGKKIDFSNRFSIYFFIALC